MSSKNIKLLYVEDDDIARENGVEYLSDYVGAIYEASDAASALVLYEEHKPQIIVTDIQMPHMNGLEFVKEIRKRDKKCQIIIITAFSDTDYLLKAVELNLVKYLIKPIQESDLNEAIQLCIESIEEDSENIVRLDAHTYFDTFNKLLVTNGKIVNLRTKEIAILSLLIKHKNRYVSYSEIEHIIWQDSVMTADALKTLVKNLKAKLPSNLISNLSGTGYKIEL
ncbi:MAG: response regulator transcription factor [Campylobacterales bacterium]